MYNLSKYRKADIEDLTKPLIQEVSVEAKLEDTYLDMIHNLDIKAQGSKGDKEEGEMAYQEGKKIIEELNNVEDKIEDKKVIRNLIKKTEIIMEKYFRSRYLKDKEKEIEPKEDAGSIPPPPGPPPQNPSQEAQSPMMASKLAKFRKVSAMLDPEDFDPNEFLDNDLKNEVIEEYAKRACASIVNKHHELTYKIDIDSGEIKIYDSEMLVLRIQTNEHLNVTSIVPENDLQEIYPYHSLEFYQKYWKIIVENIQHICLSDPSIIMAVSESTLPDVPKSSKAFIIECWNNSKKEKEYVELSFGGERETWLFKSVSVKVAQTSKPSKYIETDYLNAIVKCIDPNLKTILGRTGAVIQVIPLTDSIEIDVDFGRGLDVIRLTEKQVEIVPLER